MDFDLLEKLGKIAGIGGIAVGVGFLIFWSIIQKKIFPQLDKAHSFQLLRMLVIGSFVIAIGGLMAWVYTNQQQEGDSVKPLAAVRIQGIVLNQDQIPVEGVSVEIDGYDSESDITDQSGKYSLSLKGRSAKSFDLLFKRKNYKGTRKEVYIGFNADEDVEIESVVLHQKERPVVEEASEITETHSNPTKKNVNKGSVSLIYAGDEYGCVLDLTMTVAGKTITPQGNMVQLNDIDLGLQPYKITGIINCGAYGYCQSNGNGTLKLKNNANYYVMWKPSESATGVCQIGLYDEATYQSTSSF